ncbi:hypothetical protein RND81_08G189600 [Saponaria officinalis]|uniref:Uncharacterized protein n=1 Tax=Saponaria officinalis TaxID=3572 RepID=A0AAW1JAX9_SAPOF
MPTKLYYWPRRSCHMISTTLIPNNLKVILCFHRYGDRSHIGDHSRRNNCWFMYRNYHLWLPPLHNLWFCLLLVFLTSHHIMTNAPTCQANNRIPLTFDTNGNLLTQFI